MRKLGSTADFLANSFGFVIIHNDVVVSWSFTVGVVGDRCEIGIQTAERFRKRGLGAITTAASVDFVLSEGLSEVSWQCAQSNIGSIRTAEKVGFEKARSYMMHWLFYNEEQNLGFLAYSALEEKKYHHAIDGYERYINLSQDPPVWIFHDLARAWAGLRQTDKALEYLGIAIERGWSALEETRNAPEFEYLHKSTEWQALLRLVDTSMRVEI